MPEDFTYYWYYHGIFNSYYSLLWQEQGEYYSHLLDRDLFAMYCMMSV